MYLHRSHDLHDGYWLQIFCDSNVPTMFGQGTQVLHPLERFLEGPISFLQSAL